MKDSLEEYGYTILAVLLAGIVLIFLYKGLDETGFIHVFTNVFTSSTLG